MSQGIIHCLLNLFSFPRVSGDEPEAASKQATLLLFSPRERGRARMREVADQNRAVFPA